jgi:TRAP-type C4-dicarboxylate transport system permease small subunit
MRWVDRLNTFLGESLAWLYLAAVAVTAYEVVMRYVFNMPTTWAFELTVLLCAVCYLLAGGYVTRLESHIAITSVYDVAPPAVRRWMQVFAHLVGILAMVGLVAASWRSGLRAATIVERTGSGWDFPSPAIIKPLIVVAAVLVLLQLLVQLARDLRGQPPEPHPAPTNTALTD